MKKIYFLAPDESLFQTVQTALAREHPDIGIKLGLLSKGVKAARQLAARGVEIIITRGGTAALIRESGLEISVVEVPVTVFDIIRTVEQASSFGSRIGVVAFASMVEGIDSLSSILGVEIKKYMLSNEFEAERKVQEAFAAGANVVIGGVITCQVAARYKLPYVLIQTGAEGILQAALEAKRIAYARRLEQVKVSLFRAVLDNAYEGIAAVDQDCRITIFNPIAQKLTKVNSDDAIGKKINLIWPELRLEEIVARGAQDMGQLLTVHGTQVLCNKAPIIVNNQTVGAVATVQETGKIQQMEEQIRREIYARGHVASFHFSHILGESSQIQQTVNIAKDFAVTKSAVLILGETGTGKEVFAQSIHNHSPRSQGPFVAINCAALPSQILESELFGYVGGAFTGASKEGKPGLFTVAHGGTLLLDEIAEMDYVTQGKLLRVLQEKKVVRLGSDRVIPVDVRIIAATNKSLKTMVAENKFRADLYYRLNVLRLTIPTLAQRSKDIEVYANYFLSKYTNAIVRRPSFTPSALDALLRYPWPGNIRELQNTIERIVAVCHQERIGSQLVNSMLGDELENDFQADYSHGEGEEIKKALAAARGKLGEAANLLGVSRSTLWRKMKNLGIKK